MLYLFMFVLPASYASFDDRVKVMDTVTGTIVADPADAAVPRFIIHYIAGEFCLKTRLPSDVSVNPV